MSYTKKTVVMLLVSAILGGGAWYLNTTGVLSGISSSAIAPFVCTENNLKKQASYYRQSQVRRRKALIIEKELEAEIGTLRTANKLTAMQKKQANLRILTRQIATYNRFIKAYAACQKKTPTTVEIVPPVTVPVIPVSLPPIPEGKNTSPTTDNTTTPAIQTGSSNQSTVTVPPVIIVPSTTEYIPETTEAPLMTFPESTSEAPESTSVPANTEAPESTEAPTTEYIPETTQSAPATIPAETTEASSPTV